MKKFISAFLAISLFIALQNAAFSNSKANSFSEIASDFSSEKGDDCDDKELKFGKNFSDENFISSYQFNLFLSSNYSPAADFSLAVPTSPPNV